MTDGIYSISISMASAEVKHNISSRNHFLISADNISVQINNAGTIPQEICENINENPSNSYFKSALFIFQTVL